MTRRLLLALLLALTTLTAIAETAVDLHVFWSLRCPHCLKALPELRQMAAEHPVGSRRGRDRQRLLPGPLG